MDHPSQKETEIHVSIEKLNGRYRVRWRDETGRQRAKTLPFRESAREFEARLRTGTADPIEAPRLAPPLFGKLTERWLAEHCDVMKSPGEQIADRYRLNQHVLPHWHGTRIDRLTLTDGLALRAMLAKHMQPASVNNVLKLIKKMMNDAVDWGCLDKSPFDKLTRLPVPEQAFAYWMADERERFLARARSCDPEFHDLACVAVHTGLRLGELLGLQWDSVDFQRQMLIVRRSFCQRTLELRQQTKTGRIREVPMNAVVLAVMRRRYGLGRAGDEKAFALDFPRNAAVKLRRMARRAGVQEIRFHDLRHTFASLMAMAGVDLHVLKELLGHSSYAMTLRYAHLHPSRLAGATDRLCVSSVYSTNSKPATS